MLTNEQDQLLSAWKAADNAKKEATAKELELRNKVIEAFSDITDEMHKSIENIDLGYDRYELKIGHKLNYKLADSEAVKLALQQIATSVEGGHIYAERLVKWKPELSVSEYDKLPGGLRSTIDRVLTITPATKSLEIKQRSK